ncbi:MAG: class I SAM-dependent methyltransferase [Saprospirales bacterium]|jgi:ubiquinone/menaquinone biosynthesis C-methylase UbiE|nr:class I SAM-dependent methyltransferase [Saprospirales bacterium]MBK8920701.1 class I SAM-dependent methyltransferase [Saprospirales bacterium]
MSKIHWESIYKSKAESEYSWFQPYPRTSIEFIEYFKLPKNARIIDIGGGDSHLADALLQLGYTDITVLDISEKAIEKAKQRLGARARQVKWTVCDIAEFGPADGQYDFWHDRAAFHFLTTGPLIQQYADIAQRAVRPGGYLVLGTFSTKGPQKCSGLEVRQYSRAAMRAVFGPFFRRLKCQEEAHTTPAKSIQHFLYCGFQRQSG